MTDEEYIKRQFESDVRAKKRIARGEKNRHKAIRGCKTPSDYLTKKQRERLNGVVMSYSMGKPITWEEFRAMPEDIQKVYVLGIRERFPKVPNKELADMFGKSYSQTTRYINSLGIDSRGFGGRGASFYDTEVYDSWIKWRFGDNLEKLDGELNFNKEVFQMDAKSDKNGEAKDIDHIENVSFVELANFLTELKQQGIKAHVNITFEV